MDSQKGPETAFKFDKYFFSLVVHHLTIFDRLIQKAFWVFQKIKVSNLCNPFHDIKIIPFSTS